MPRTHFSTTQVACLQALHGAATMCRCNSIGKGTCPVCRQSRFPGQQSRREAAGQRRKAGRSVKNTGAPHLQLLQVEPLSCVLVRHPAALNLHRRWGATPGHVSALSHDPRSGCMLCRQQTRAVHVAAHQHCCVSCRMAVPRPGQLPCLSLSPPCPTGLPVTGQCSPGRASSDPGHALSGQHREWWHREGLWGWVAQQAACRRVSTEPQQSILGNVIAHGGLRKFRPRELQGWENRGKGQFAKMSRRGRSRCWILFCAAAQQG